MNNCTVNSGWWTTEKEMVTLVMMTFLSVLCTYIDVFLLDGTREDFLFDGEAINKTYFPHLATSAHPFLKRTVVTETPTYTTNCLHAMYTGKIVHPLYVLLALAPSMYILTGKPGEEPCVLSALRQRGYNLSVSGDDTLAKLFPKYFNQSKTAYSFNIGDYDTVDDIVFQSIQDLWTGEAAIPNQFSMYHLLGADHIAHSEGLASPTLRERYNKYDALISTHLTYLHNRWARGEVDEYVVIVLSDHGMTDKGTHGGFSAVETHTPFLLLTSSTSLREGLETRMTKLVPQRHVLRYVLSEVFSAEIGADAEPEAEAKTPSNAISAIDIYIMIAYTTFLAILSIAVTVRKRPISPIILTCQFLCAVAERFACNETAPLIFSFVMEVIWKTRSCDDTNGVKCNNKSFIKRCNVLVFYGIWTACLIYITRSVLSVMPIALVLVTQILKTRAELQHILMRLMIKGMGHAELFSYRLPAIYLTNKPNNSANPWSCALYVFLIDGIPAIITGSVYDFTNLAAMTFSSLLFRWHPLYNSICISRLVVGVVTAVFSLMGVSVKRIKMQSVALKRSSYSEKQ